MKKRANSRKRAWLLAPCLVGTLVATPSCGDPSFAADEELGEVSQRVCTRKAECPDVANNTCNLQAWPGGNIYYSWFTPTPPATSPRTTPTADRTAIEATMRRWESASGGAIRFVLSNTQTPRIQFINVADAALGGTPGPVSYQTCAQQAAAGQPCYVALDGSNADHELGHAVGLNHTFTRNDRQKYLHVRHKDGEEFRCSDWDVARCNSPTKPGPGSGPFEYVSVMNYRPTDPDIERWNLTPICLGEACAVCSAGPGKPYYQPTRGDGSAAAELYLKASSSRWSIFRRTVNDDGLAQPADYSIHSNVFIAPFRSVAAAAYPNGSIDMYVTGSDGHVYEKTQTGASFTSWTDRGTPAGTGSVSDPGAVSWGSGRLDLTVRQGSVVYISTWVTGHGFTSWQSLGAPGDTAPASSPAITSSGPNVLNVFVRGANNRLYWKSCTANCLGNTGTWSSWQVVGSGTFLGKPAAVTQSNGTVAVFMHGLDHLLYRIVKVSTTWDGFFAVSNSFLLKDDTLCAECSSPAAGSRPGNAPLDVYVRGANDQIYLSSWFSTTQTWTGFTPIGAVLGASPATITKARSTDRLDLYAVMSEERTGPNDLKYGVWWKEYSTQAVP